jgi:hypothetical protein
MKTLLFSLIFSLLSIVTHCQKAEIPSVYKNLKYNSEGQLVFTDDKGIEYIAKDKPALYNFKQITNPPKGTAKGLAFDLGEDFSGLMYYGLIPYGDSKHPQVVFFKKTLDIVRGKAEVDLSVFKEKYDMVGWNSSGKGVLGYRIVNKGGEIIYDGKAGFKGKGPFELDVTLIDGPFINQLSDNSCIISFRLNMETEATIKSNNKVYTNQKKAAWHEIKVDGLKANTQYSYTVNYGENSLGFSFKTAPEKGSRTSFVFAYASDSRNGKGGGERDVHGVNHYIMKKIMALSIQQNAAFFQFTGDMINGYLNNADEQRLQYTNWFHSIEAFAHYFPVYVGMGNHEALTYSFYKKEDTDMEYKKAHIIERFPFETESAEAVFAEFVCNPIADVKSEDGSKYDPNPKKIDFPSYSENVYDYVYDNVAVIVLNSNYWYAPTLNASRNSPGGNLHAYIMDNQLAWLKNTLAKYEKDKAIDHVFITSHTPFFPNGGHVEDDMWYSGNNNPRPHIAGKQVEKGIIERRDELLDLIINQSTKVKALLTGDEHNYAKTKINSEMNIYPDNWKLPKISISRTMWQINNGAAGAPYYAQEQTPWTPFVSGFSTQNALVLFDVNGKKLSMRVLNPDTLELVDSLEF